MNPRNDPSLPHDPAHSPPHYQWKFWERDTSQVEAISAESRVSPALAALLLERGLEHPQEIQDFLHPKLAKLRNPSDLKGMDAAVDRLILAMEKGERIVVWGDYDVDGVTSTTQLLLFFEAIGYPIDFHVPNRLRDGYGLNSLQLETLAKEGVQVVITVDCGISNQKEVAHATELGVDILIIDHHEIPEHLPAACAIVDPHQEDCSYPFMGMAAAGLTFHLLIALRGRLRAMGWFDQEIQEPDIRAFLGLAAIGTVADVAPLRDVNRLLTRSGLDVLKRTDSPGVRALIDVCMSGRSRPLNAGFIGFQMGPRINAAGRLSDASKGVEMLAAAQYDTAYRIAVAVDEENQRRREIQERMVDEAVAMVEEQSPDGELHSGYVLARQGWHPGVAGIVASKLVDKFYRPFIVVALDGEVGKASARSIPGFHLVRALTELQSELIHFGGHAHAAGLAIRTEHVESFRERFDALAKDALPEERLMPTLSIHGEILLEDIDGQYMADLAHLEPFGMGNRRPNFVARGVQVRKTRIVKGNHLQMTLAQGGVEFPSIAFGMGDRCPDVGRLLDVVFYPDWNEWNGRRSLQLQVRDFQSA